MPISKMDGAPGTIRTSDPQIRSLMLYPAELRARFAWHMGLEEPDCIQKIWKAAKERSSYRLPPRFARSGKRWFSARGRMVSGFRLRDSGAA
jgi:hypothetical protein